MNPQPFKKAGLVLLGIPEIKNAPENLALLAMRCIAAWSYVECEQIRLLSNMLRSDYAVVSAGFLAIKSPAARKAAIKGAASTALDGRELDLFDAVYEDLKAPERFRNKLAHSLWVNVGEPNTLALLDPREFVRVDAQIAQSYHHDTKTKDLKFPMVYTEKDLLDGLHEITVACGKVRALGVVLAGGDGAVLARSELWRTVRNPPRERRSSTQTSPASQPQSPASESQDQP